MAASCPELPEELMRIGLVIMTARAHDARVDAHPADSAGVRRKLPDQTHGPAAAWGQGDTMNAFAANFLEAADVEAADLLALARLDE
jgi:hypothetical protein